MHSKFENITSIECSKEYTWNMGTYVKVVQSSYNYTNPNNTYDICKTQEI